MAAISAAAQLHAAWINMLQPDGLVVSAAVLDEWDLYVKRPQDDVVALREATPDGRLPNLQALATLLGWPAPLLVAPDAALRLDLPDLHATVRPTHVLTDRAGAPLLLIEWSTHELDRSLPGEPWTATPTERFERLLSHTGHAVGLQVTPTHARLIFAPAAQAPGRLSFCFADLHLTDGRLLLDALHMLLGSGRLLTAPQGKRLLDVLRASRDRQEQVTNQLAAQVQDALEILLQGFDTANERTRGDLLRELSGDALYDGLTTVLLRLVFVLYAEDRGLLPMEHPLYAEHYSVAALGDQLARDAVAHGEAQTRRFGAWARVLSLSRMVWKGASHKGLQLPPRQGELFDPDRHPFLEGRPTGSNHATDAARVPPVDDAVVHGVLERLLHLEGQRISYRNLEVEQLGSVYEAMMGYEVCRAATPAMRLKSGAWVELGELAESDEPYLLLQDRTGERNAKLRKSAPALADARPTGDVDVDRAAIASALEPLADAKRAHVPAQRHYLQPGSERRNSGSHYTPRALTEPLVRRTLAPLLGDQPSPEQILALRVCDPAMGSGAFLAEVVRQLAAALVQAWARSGTTPPSDADPLLVASRRVAERCVYGVDKNPRAVQLARLSLWLITSSAELPFTFVDHNLKAGDALVGLTLEQVAAFDYAPTKKRQEDLQTPVFRQVMQTATRLRAEILATQRTLHFALDEHGRKKTFLHMADEEIWDERRVADLLVACAWDVGAAAALTKRLKAQRDVAWSWYPNPDKQPLPHAAQALVDALPMRPFHWWLEFPEVFGDKRGGFDAVVGNPPFAGKNTIIAQNGQAYIKWLQALWPHAHGNSDLCGYFFLRTADLLRPGGWFSLVASNTIRQGNTLDTGLRHLTANGGVTLTQAETDLKWPVRGVNVVVDRVTGTRGKWAGPSVLNGQPVDAFSCDLTAGGELPEVQLLAVNANRCFQGSNVLGKGFVLDVPEAEALLAEDPRRAEVLRPYIGGRELNNNVPPDAHAPVPFDRYVISFGDRSLEEAAAWPVLLERVERLVKPERERNNRDQYRNYWWIHGERRPGLYRTIAPLERCLCAARVTKHLLWTFQPVDRVFSEQCDVAALSDWPSFAILQSRVHEAWARDRGSSMKTDLRYTPSRCFETFPFPRPNPEQADALARTGEALYAARQAFMAAEQVGMTQTWNRVEDPHDRDPAVAQLRGLRADMDRAVLEAYGWGDLATDGPLDGPALLLRLRALNTARAAEEAARAAEANRRAKPSKRRGANP